MKLVCTGSDRNLLFLLGVCFSVNLWAQDPNSSSGTVLPQTQSSGPAISTTNVVSQADIQKLEQQIRNTEQKLANESMKQVLELRKEILDWTKYLFMLFGALAIITSGSVVGTVIWARKCAKKIIEQSIYRVDPTCTTVVVPSMDFDNEKKRLQRLGFKNIGTYPVLNPTDCLKGCVVVHISNEADIKAFHRFIEETNPDFRKVAFVLYTSIRIPPDITQTFENITWSNSPATLGAQVFSVARELNCLQS